MEVQRALKLQNIAEEQVKCAKEYLVARKAAAKAKSDLDILLTASLKDIREKKSNVGYDMARLILCEDNPLARELYQTELEQTALYKGLEKVIEALQSQISLEQSVMKYILKGEGFSP